MPKVKTCKSAAKRFKKTASGKLMRHRMGTRHLRTSKTGSRKRRLRKAKATAGADLKRIRRLLRIG